MTWKLFLLMHMLGLTLFVLTGAQDSETDRSNTLDRVALFARTLEERNLTVDGWSVYAREQKNVSGNAAFHQQVNRAKQSFPNYSWRKLEKEGHTGWEAYKKKNASGAEVKLTFLVYPEGGRLRTSALYQIQAPSFQKAKWEKIRREIRRDMAKIFHGSEHIFSCVRADDGDKMRFGLLQEGERFLKDFSAAPIEQIEEKTFVSISAYNEAWNDGVFSDKQKMNVQVALRSNGDRTAVTLGTPIITAEY
ncbi:hypothetical protein EWH99_05890 [Sporolactobacillus sp. THM7-7]|nr:hypothetical protein EWH99_05890 [Sporolactobacillus sp. THM7-7]